jgi:hypothetical protein
MESVLWGTSARYVIRPSVGNPFAGKDKAARLPKPLSGMFAKTKSRYAPRNNSLGQEVVLLMNSLNDKAYLYKTGQIDVIKDGNIHVRKFHNMKDASLYLLKTGWQYVR